jgi:hypothetical protein
MLAYLQNHWRGNHHIAQSLLVNGALVLFVMVALTAVLFVSTDPGPLSRAALGVITVIFLISIIWAAVGIVRSAIRTLRDHAFSWVAKATAIIALIVVAATLFALRNDFQILWRAWTS